ncbi:MAG TPA: TerB family tellurite resistance protein [Chitinophagaceae bacterium]|nr:TerB family tellurite resistance protein [Chitinophagaceae bacterium]
MEKNEALTTESILEGHSDQEKAAYLAAIASIATADKQASPEELSYITKLCEAAGLPEEQKQRVLKAAKEISGEELKQSLDVLKNSQLKYSLITDLIAFAKSDSNYSEEESQYVYRVAQQLGVDEKQFSLLNQFADNVKTSDIPAQGVEEPGFLSGIKEKMQKAGINTGTLFKGLIAIAGPILLAKMFSRKGSSGGSGGGALGGLGGILAGAGLTAGLGSLIGMLGGGKGMGSTGGLLDRILPKF